MTFKKDKVLRIKIENEKNADVLELTYAVLDMDIADRWINLINENNLRNNDLRFNYRRILEIEDILSNVEKFRSNISYINENYDRKLDDIVSLDFLRNNENILNDLHEEFEIYGDRLEELIKEGYFDDPKKSHRYNPVWPGDTHNKILHEAFLLLNEQIHNMEAVFRNWNRLENSLCTCLFDFMPAGLHEDLKPEDYFLFTAERFWGWAYLGYNTLGKHWSSASHDNDIEVVLRKQIRPQQRFAAETYLDFGMHPNDYFTRVNLYKWWLDNNFSNEIDPRLRLDEFALGFIPVAKIYCYKINNNSPILISENIDRKKWNKDIWSKFSIIKEVKIVEVDYHANNF